MNIRSYSPLPSVSIVTAHGRQTLDAQAGDRLIDVLNKHRIPWSAVAAYVVGGDGGHQQPVTAALDEKIGDIAHTGEIQLYFNRNINPFMFSLDDFRAIPSADGTLASEYYYQRLDNDAARADSMLKKLSAEECREVIAQRVGEAIREFVPAQSRLVIGVSGGGDSNALLHALSRIDDQGLDLHPVFLTGIPEWDAGLDRAQALCREYGLPLTVLDENAVKSLLGVPTGDPTPLGERFEREFVKDDFEFLGTLLIRLALSQRAREVGATHICTGLNLEDLVCEAMFRVSTGLTPAPFPVRQIGAMTLVFPLWMCPKRIIDGCFPKFSLDNYEARYPCLSLGRNLYYSVVYALQSQFPAFTDQLARGLSEISLRDPVTYSVDEQLGFYTERPIPLPLRRKFERMLG